LVVFIAYFGCVSLSFLGCLGVLFQKHLLRDLLIRYFPYGWKYRGLFLLIKDIMHRQAGAGHRGGLFEAWAKPPLLE